MAERFYLDLPGVPGRLVHVVVLQNRRLLVERMTCDESNVLNPYALGVQLSCKRMAERMRSNSFAKAQALQVGSKLVDEALAVASVWLPGLAAGASRQVREEARVAGRFDVGKEVEEACLEKTVVDRHLADRALAFEALPSALASALRQVFVHGFLDREAPHALVLHDVSHFELGDLIDPGACEKRNERAPPAVRILLGPGQEGLGVEDLLDFLWREQTLGLVLISQ